MSCTIDALGEGISGFTSSPLRVLFRSSRQRPDCLVRTRLNQLKKCSGSAKYIYQNMGDWEGKEAWCYAADIANTTAVPRSTASLHFLTLKIFLISKYIIS